MTGWECYLRLPQRAWVPENGWLFWQWFLRRVVSHQNVSFSGLQNRSLGLKPFAQLKTGIMSSSSWFAELRQPLIPIHEQVDLGWTKKWSCLISHGPWSTSIFPGLMSFWALYKYRKEPCLWKQPASCRRWEDKERLRATWVCRPARSFPSSCYYQLVPGVFSTLRVNKTFWGKVHRAHLVGLIQM
jgi:hypothetical protein